MGIIAQKPSIAHLLYRQILQSSRQNPGKVSSSGKDFSSHDITGQKKIPALASRDWNGHELSRVCDLSRTTVYKYIDLLEG